MKQFAFVVLFIIVLQCSAATADINLRVVNARNNQYGSSLQKQQQQQQQRRDLSVSNWFWSILNHIGVHPPCVGPAKDQKHCHHSSSSSSSHSSSSSGGSSSGGSSSGGSSSGSWASDGYDTDGNTENTSNSDGSEL